MIFDLIVKGDIKLFHFINETMANSFFNFIMPILTNQNVWVLPLLAGWLSLLFFGKKKGRIAAIILLIAFILTDAIAAQLIKPLIGRMRPSHAMADGINLLVKKGGKYGFPSNHAANTMVLAIVIGYFWDSWKPWLFSLSILIGFTRIYVGVHYPLDVIAGWLFGYIFAWLILSLWVIIKMRELKRGSTWIWYEGEPPAYSG